LKYHSKDLKKKI